MAKAGHRSAEKPQEITDTGFLMEFMRIHETAQDESFLFFLGSGASVTSGIRPGGEMAGKWVKDIYNMRCKNTGSCSLETWATPENLGIEGFDLAKTPMFYAQVYERRFAHHPESGYAYLEDAMAGAEPGIGYSILAQVLEKTRHKVVVTTNFDNLVADALYVYTRVAPLVCGHESLAGFVKARLRRPLVCKIHRDLLLAPKNDPAGTRELAKPWKGALRRLFSEYTPIVIGYGGNDGSVMDFLSALKRGDIREGIYWLYRIEDGVPDKRIMGVLRKHNGTFVPIVGFDEFMIQLGDCLKYPLLHEMIEQRAKDRAERYHRDFEAFRDNLNRRADSPKSAKAVSAVRRAVDAAVKNERTPWAWALRADFEEDPEVAETLYRQGVAEFPTSAELINRFAIFMRRVRKDYDEAEKLFRRAVELDPSHGGILGNLAKFVWLYRKDYGEAEKLYRRAIDLDPNRAANVAALATFMWDVRKDREEAEKLYRRAIELGPNDANNVGNYAGFLLAGGNLTQARAEAVRAWDASAGNVRQLAAEVAFYRSLIDAAQGRDDTPSLGRLRYIIESGFTRLTWSFDEVLAAVDKSLSPENRKLYRAIADAILDPDKVKALDSFERWTKITPIPISEPWPLEE